MELKTARNIAIVLLIAAAVFLLPGGGQAATTFEAILLIGFGVGFGYLGLRLYREHRIGLHSLGDRHRALLYGAIALGVFAAEARTRMWRTIVPDIRGERLCGASVSGRWSRRG